MRLALPPGPWCGARPALEGMAEAGGLAETELFGNGVDGQLLVVQQLFGTPEAQLIQQLLVAVAVALQVATQAHRAPRR